MADGSTKRAKPGRTPVVTAKRVRCPDCHSVDCKRTRTLDSEPAIISRRMQCRSCKRAFIVIFD
jgi:hypothetical protein